MRFTSLLAVILTSYATALAKEETPSSSSSSSVVTHGLGRVLNGVGIDGSTGDGEVSSSSNPTRSSIRKKGLGGGNISISGAGVRRGGIEEGRNQRDGGREEGVMMLRKKSTSSSIATSMMVMESDSASSSFKNIDGTYDILNNNKSDYSKEDDGTYGGSGGDGDGGAAAAAARDEHTGDREVIDSDEYFYEGEDDGNESDSSMNNNNNHDNDDDGYYDYDDPPWNNLGQSISIVDDDTWASTAEHVMFSPDGETLAIGYTIMDRTLSQKGFKLYTYTYVDKIKSWIPITDDQPIVVKPLVPEYRGIDRGNEVSVLDVQNDYLAIGQIAYVRVDDPNDPTHSNITVKSQIQFYYLGSTMGRGRSEIYWSSNGFPPLTNSDSPTKDIELLGNSISLSDNTAHNYRNGIRIAIGIPTFSNNHHGNSKKDEILPPGKVIVYRMNDDSMFGPWYWEMIGSPIIGNHSNFGKHVQLNRDGTIVAIVGSYPKSSNNNKYPEDHNCLIQVYKYIETNTEEGSNHDGVWRQIGSDITDDDLLCDSIELSEDGQTIVTGPKYHTVQFDDNGPIVTNTTTTITRGHIRVFTLDKKHKNKWNRKGVDIDTILKPYPIENNQSYYVIGNKMSLSKNGNRLMVSVTTQPYYYNQNTHRFPDSMLDETTTKNYILTFDWDYDKKYSPIRKIWKQIDGYLYAYHSDSNNNNIQSMTMSSDGTKFAYGSTYKDGTVEAYSFYR